jgi:hypothetical protein
LEPVDTEKAEEPEKADEWVEHYPEFGELLPDGRLRVKTSGRTDGEIWDGYIEVGPEDPRYFPWTERLRNKDAYFAQRAEAISEARRQRRGAGRAATQAAPESGDA